MTACPTGFIGERGVRRGCETLPSAVTALRFGPRIGAMLSMTMHPTSAYYKISAEGGGKQVVFTRSPR